MSETYEVISAFLDDEAFNPTELADALSDPAGRALLIDLLALRHLTQSEGTTAMPVARTWPASFRAVLAVAAVLVALVGGYLGGVRQSGAAVSTAPAPTRVVQGPTTWQDVVPGRMQ